MTYLVMECHPGYAVVLDQTGRFLKVANLNYQVGETVSFVIECTAEEEPVTIHSLRRRRILLSAASLAVLGTWHICLTPYGAVRIQINPDLKLTVNRLDYVISADGLNDDGLRLLDGYRFRGQKLEQASDDLADRAMEMGYLKEGGQILLTLESSHENWIAKTEDRLLTELENHLNDTVSVTASAAPEIPASADTPLPETAPADTLSDVPVNAGSDAPAGSDADASAPAPSSGISRFQNTDEEEDDDSEDDEDEEHTGKDREDFPEEDDDEEDEDCGGDDSGDSPEEDDGNENAENDDGVEDHEEPENHDDDDNEEEPENHDENDSNEEPEGHDENDSNEEPEGHDENDSEEESEDED
uniref:anti-sigma-I factor RsgI family protein n=1 Tax=Candidatus Ventrimonas sp. TaxID=3048889 RepID=UPI003FEE28D8